MPQLHFYVPKPIAEAVRRRADAQGTSVSALVATWVRREVDASAWPEEFFDRVVGGWQGAPLERPEQPPVESRDRLR